MRRRFGAGHIELQQGDITRCRVDAITTAANEGLRGGGGVDGAVHRAAGPRLLEACRAIGGCATGSAVITEAYDLAERGVRFVIHAVGPVWRSGRAGEPDLLAGAYAQSLQLADSHDCRSLALPSISTGVYGFPVEQAAPLAIAQCAAFLRSGPQQLERIVFSLFDGETLRVFEQALETQPEA
jgi:O-acetyl-ADP-ribose deacetylase (regulator of RNase III)